MNKKAINFYLIIVIFLSLFGCSSTEEKTKEEKKSDVFFSYGTQSLMRGEYTNALDGLMKANELNPNKPDILNNLGMAYYYKRRKGKAVELLKTALTIDPKHSDAKINLASIYLNEGKLNASEKLYEEVLDDLLYKRQFITYNNLGKISLKRNNVPKALDFTDKAIKEYQEYCPALLQRGQILMRMGQLRDAQIALDTSIKGACYENVKAHYYRGLNLMKMRRYSRAEEIMEKIRVDFAKSGFAPLAQLRLREIRKNKKFKDVSRLNMETPNF